MAEEVQAQMEEGSMSKCEACGQDEMFSVSLIMRGDDPRFNREFTLCEKCAAAVIGSLCVQNLINKKQEAGDDRTNGTSL